MKKFLSVFVVALLIFSSCSGIGGKVKIKESGTYSFEKSPESIIVYTGNVTFWQSVISLMRITDKVDITEPVCFDNAKVNDLKIESGTSINLSNNSFVVSAAVDAEDGFYIENDGTSKICRLTLNPTVKSAEVLGHVDDLIIECSEAQITVRNASVGNIVINGSNNKVNISGGTNVENMDLVGNANEYYLTDGAEVARFETAVLHELDM